MPQLTKRYLTRDDLNRLLENPEAFHAFIPNGSHVWIIKEAKKHRSHKEGVLDADIIYPAKRLRLVKYDAVNRKAIWAEWPAGMTVEQHSRLYQGLAKKHANIMPTLPETKKDKKITLTPKEVDKFTAILQAM